MAADRNAHHPGISPHLAPEVAVVTLGVETDAQSLDVDEISEEHRTAVVAAYRRPYFKNRIFRAFYDGMVNRPQTTFGTMNGDVLAHLDPGVRREGFVRIIQENAWPE